MKLEDLLSTYKTETGKEPDEQVKSFIGWVFHVGNEFESIGFRDGSNDKKPLPDHIFDSWAKNCFPDDTELQAICAEYVKDCYQFGLSKGKAIA